MSMGKSSIYKERAQLNLLIYEQLYFFFQKNEFVALIIQAPVQNDDDFNFDDFMMQFDQHFGDFQHKFHAPTNKMNHKKTESMFNFGNIFNASLCLLDQVKCLFSKLDFLKCRIMICLKDSNLITWIPCLVSKMTYIIRKQGHLAKQ